MFRVESILGNTYKSPKLSALADSEALCKLEVKGKAELSTG